VGIPLAQQWADEQEQWQRMMLSYADAAVRDESFLVHLGNAMRGSLLAGKPYPGTTSEPPPAKNATMANDEVVFALRRLEGRLGELVSAVDALTRRMDSLSPPPVTP
jgi:hypothetical protein